MSNKSYDICDYEVLWKVVWSENLISSLHHCKNFIKLNRTLAIVFSVTVKEYKVEYKIYSLYYETTSLFYIEVVLLIKCLVMENFMKFKTSHFKHIKQ